MASTDSGGGGGDITWNPAIITELMKHANTVAGIIQQCADDDGKQRARLDPHFVGDGAKTYYEQQAMREQNTAKASDCTSRLAAIGNKALTQTLHVDAASKSVFLG